MKIRNGFVSNSSSTSFYITNHSDENLTLLDFVLENHDIVKDFNNEYEYKHTLEEMIECAKSRGQVFEVGKNYATYGDEDGDVLGQVFDYMLRYGGKSKNFSWGFHEWRR